MNLASFATLPAALALATPLIAQEPAGDEAETLFRQAVAAQFTASEPAPVRGFRMKVNLRERMPGEGRKEIVVEHWYLDERGGLIRQQLRDVNNNTRVTTAFDGKRYWQQEEGEAVFDLSSKTYAQDRRKINQSIDLSETLLLLLDLDRLHRSSREVVRFEGKVGPGLRGILPLRDGDWRFELHLASDKLHPRYLRLVPPPSEATDKQEGRSSGTKTEVEDIPELREQWYQLDGHRSFEGRHIPRKITVFPFEGSRYPERILEVMQLSWRRPPESSEFQAPTAQ